MMKKGSYIPKYMNDDLDAKSRRFGKLFNQHSNRILTQAFFEFLKERGATTLIELGAHRATSARQFKRINPERIALAVEASPFNYEKFKENVEGAGVSYWNCAINDVTGPVEMILSDGDMDRKRGHTRTSNSLLKNKAYGRTKAIEVPGYTFDDLIDLAVEKGVLPAAPGGETCLWVDLEGIVDRFLRGAQKRLPPCLAVFVEVEHDELFEGQTAFSDVHAMFDDLGFAAVLRDNEYYPAQNNVIYVNRSLLSRDTVTDLQRRFRAGLEAFELEPVDA